MFPTCSGITISNRQSCNIYCPLPPQRNPRLNHLRCTNLCRICSYSSQGTHAHAHHDGCLFRTDVFVTHSLPFFLYLWHDCFINNGCLFPGFVPPARLPAGRLIQLFLCSLASTLVWAPGPCDRTKLLQTSHAACQTLALAKSSGAIS